MDSETTAREDERWMGLAIRLARRGLGQAAPNPSVGCLLVRDGRVVGRGITGPGGRPHAETVALDRAGVETRGATAYVTLEPCAHHGETPPCAEALIEAGIARVVTGITDPDPRVAGRGNERLRAAGLAVTMDVRRDLAAQVIAGFASRLQYGRPEITLKLASSIDSRIATRSGESRWITGETARQGGHFLRARHDAILTGSGTVRADDPALTCRLPGLSVRSPIRVVLDSHLGIRLDSTLVTTAHDISTVIITTAAAPATAAAELAMQGAEIIEVAATSDARVSLDAAMAVLAARGVNSVLVECGATLAASLLESDLVDHLVWFRAPMLIGGDGLAAVVPFGIDSLSAAARFKRVSATAIGEDMMETYRRRP